MLRILLIAWRGLQPIHGGLAGCLDRLYVIGYILLVLGECLSLDLGKDCTGLALQFHRLLHLLHFGLYGWIRSEDGNLIIAYLMGIVVGLRGRIEDVAIEACKNQSPILKMGKYTIAETL